jgi:DNA-binding NarL/FixJ family response regulator
MHHQSRVFIVDDHPIFRKGLSHLINEEPDLAVCGEAESVGDAIREIRQTKPDVVILDITLKDTSGLELIHMLNAQFAFMPILVVSMHDESIFAERVLRAGALGYINKQEVTGKVVRAVHQVLEGRIYASEAMVETLLGKIIFKPANASENPLECLSDREMEIFQLVGKGFGRKEIAGMLHVSVKTVGTHRENIKKKLQLKNSAELMRCAVDWDQRQKIE